MRFVLVAAIVVLLAVLGAVWLRSEPAPTPNVVNAEPDRPVSAGEPLKAVSMASVAPKAVEKSADVAPKQADFDAALARNELGIAESLLEKADPKSPLALEGKPKLLMREDNIEGAKEALAACVQQLPNSTSCLSNRVLAEMGSGTPDSQLKAANDCLAVTPNDPKCRNWLGMIDLNNGDPQSAVKLYGALLAEAAKGSGDPALDPPYLNWQMARAEESAGDSQAARIYYERACQQKNLSACAWLQGNP